MTTRARASRCHQPGARSARKYSNVPAQPPAVTTGSTLSKLARQPNAQRRRQFGTKRPPVQIRPPRPVKRLVSHHEGPVLLRPCCTNLPVDTLPGTCLAAEGRAGQQPTMPLRECRAGRLARDHRLTLNQARRASARRRRESKRGGQFPAAWPSSVPCTTWRPCSTSGCRRRPVRHRAPSGRAEARCRTVNTELAAMGGDGPYAAGPSVRPGLMRCRFIGIVLPLRTPLPGGLPLLAGASAAIVPQANRIIRAICSEQARCHKGNHSRPDNSGKPVKFFAPTRRYLNLTEAPVVVKRNVGLPLPDARPWSQPSRLVPRRCRSGDRGQPDRPAPISGELIFPNLLALLAGLLADVPTAAD